MSGNRRPRRWWPQRVRTRLTLLYAALFLAAGSVLLALTYGLVAHSLPSHPSSPRPDPKLLALCKQAAQRGGQGKPGGQPEKVVSPSEQEKCRLVFAAGAQAGTQSQRSKALGDLLWFSLIGLGAMTVLSAATGWIVAGRVLRPVRSITETARRASEEHLGERLALSGPQDELKELADTFDDMLERLDRAFGAQKRFVANASHELRTPLTVMRTSIDVTLAKPARSPEQLEAMAERVRRAIDRAERTIDALLTLAVSDQGTTLEEPVDLATAAEDALDDSAAAIAGRGLQVASTLDPAVARGDPSLLERMVANLVDNAVRHNEPGGWIRVVTGTAQGRAFLEVTNSGPRVAAGTVGSLMEPFGRARARSEPDDGPGLGLSIVRSIATAHGATLDVRSRPEGGLAVSVTVAGAPSGRDGSPVAAEPPDPQPELRAPPDLVRERPGSGRPA